ncbi:MAG TPA: hypothetical protein VFD48_11950 [Pyrinomonadaceae bacterium]|nr:hypothetical protein [Pyrinomonadaceae bacterium]
MASRSCAAINISPLRGETEDTLRGVGWGSIVAEAAVAAQYLTQEKYHAPIQQSFGPRQDCLALQRGLGADDWH